MTDDRPEWVTCVARYSPGAWFSRPRNETWCGQSKTEFKFLDWNHAIGNALNRGRLTVCPDCLRAVVNLLENQ